MGCSRVQKSSGCLRSDPSADLHSSRKSGERAHRLSQIILIGRVLRGIKEDYVPSLKPQIPVDRSIIGGVRISHKILSGSSLKITLLIPQGAPYDLFDSSIMYIDAWSDPHSVLLP